MAMVCKHCGEELVFSPDRGWVHMYQGRPGGTYMQYCRSCGWMGAPYPSLVRCPNPGCNAELYDHHCALPVEQGARR